MTAERQSAVRADLRDAAVLVGTELRCRLRAVRANQRRLLAVAVGYLVFVGGIGVMVWMPATAYGRLFAGGQVPVGATGVALGILGFNSLYLGAAAGLGQENVGATGPLVRTSIPPRAVALGRLVTELATAAVLLALVALVGLVAVAIGAGSPVPVAVLGVALVPFGLASLAVGRVVGTTIRVVNRRFQVSLWTKALAYLAFMIVVFVGSQQLVRASLDDLGRLGEIVPDAFLPGTPVQAYASVLLAPLGATPRPLGVLVAGGVLAVSLVGIAVALRAETQLLLADDASGDADATPSAGSRGVPRPFAVVPSGAVAWRYLLRTRRDPRMLAHLTSLLFGVLAMGASAISNPGIVSSLGQPAAIIAGGTIAGAAYCLNPLGDDRNQLPFLFTSTKSSAVLLRGRALAGLILGIPLAVGLGVPLGLLDHSIEVVLAQSLFAVGFAVAGTGTALGLGAVVPRFDRREYMSVERAHPSTMALLGFMFGGLVVGAVGLFLVSWTLSTAALGRAAAVWAVYLAVVGVPAAAGYRYAVRRFDRLQLDEL